MTDAAMPRFWISPQESVDFVLRIVDLFLCSVDQIGEFGERTKT